MCIVGPDLRDTYSSAGICQFGRFRLGPTNRAEESVEHLACHVVPTCMMRQLHSPKLIWVETKANSVSVCCVRGSAARIAGEEDLSKLWELHQRDHADVIRRPVGIRFVKVIFLPVLGDLRQHQLEWLIRKSVEDECCRHDRRQLLNV